MVWSYTSTSPICLHGVDSDDFTVTSRRRYTPVTSSCSSHVCRPIYICYRPSYVAITAHRGLYSCII
jgi:hypothetical protein